MPTCGRTDGGGHAETGAALQERRAVWGIGHVLAAAANVHGGVVDGVRATQALEGADGQDAAGAAQAGGAGQSCLSQVAVPRCAVGELPALTNGPHLYSQSWARDHV